jgi:hypothetical protein
MSEYTLERLTPAHFPDLQILFKDAFRANLALEFIQRKYDTSAFGLSYIGYIAYSATREPAAYYGVFPSIVSVDGEHILAAQSGDTMTHSNHRRKGLFGILAEATFALARESGIKFIYGFPNKNSYPGFMKLGWTCDHYLNLYRVKVRTLPLSKVAKVYPVFSGAYRLLLRLTINSSLRPDKTFQNSILADSGSGVLHDKRFFEYKKYYPKLMIQTPGGVVYARLDGRLMAGDFEAKTEHEFLLALKHLKKLAFRGGISEIDFQFSPGTLVDQWISKLATASTGMAACYFDLGSDLPLNKLKYGLSDFDTF